MRSNQHGRGFSTPGFPSSSSSRFSELMIALFAIAILTMFLSTFPAWMLDLLIVVNLTVSLLLLVVALYVPNPATLLTFPTLLLFTTLFRLGLNVASTRLILLNGYAGEVIQSFGLFLVQGDIIVGVIIFSIITVVSFLVIARGAARIAEVAARFTLDALPGKQMAIEADMRAGLVSPQEAVHRREELRKESQLYGNMDGAMRFVQGDVIAGIFIIFANIIGGLILGVTRGMGFADAAETYTVLTVGDGLISQIPALMIAICAGVVVSRVSSAEGATLGADVQQQLFSRPITLRITATLVLFAAFLPGLPWWPFVLIGLALLGVSFRTRESVSEESRGRRALDGSTLPAGTGEPLLLGAAQQPSIAPCVVSLDRAVLYELYRVNQDSYRGWIDELEAAVWHQVGIRLPAVTVRADAELAGACYVVHLNGVLIAQGKILLDSVLVEAHPSSAPLLGLELLKEEEHPLHGLRMFWAQRSPFARQVLQQAEIRSFDFFEALMLRVVAFVCAHPEEVLPLTEVQAELQRLQGVYPTLITELLEQRLIDAPQLTDLLHQLVREGMNVGALRQILEAISTFFARRRQQGHPMEQGAFDREDLLAYIRESRKRSLVTPFLSAHGSLQAIRLGPDTELAFEDIAADSYDVEKRRSVHERRVKLLDIFRRTIEPLLARGILPLVLVVRRDLRLSVAETLPLITPFDSGVPLKVQVFSLDEVDPSISVETVAAW
jgi:type III secretion protein V